MSALPSLTQCGLDTEGRSVWTHLLKAEEKASLDPSRQTAARYNDPLVAVRTVGFFLQDFSEHSSDGYLGSTPYLRLLREIRSCLEYMHEDERYDAIVQLGRLHQEYLMRAFRSNAGGRPTPSHHPSRPSFDVLRDRILDEVDKIAQTRHTVRRQAFLRDGYRCTLTGLYDIQSCVDMPEIEKASLESAKPGAFLEVAHIFSESAQNGDKNYAATVFAILDMFGLRERAKSLYGSGTNELHNVITMAADFYICFDRFILWLEPVHNEENTYDICLSPKFSRLLTLRMFLPDPPRVTFRVEPGAAAAAAAKGKQLKLPDPVLIAIRAACARVANLSGAAEQIDRILRDKEDMPVLANDGSMAELLSSCLMLTS
ncbi:hypothetical protein H2248_002851 [Termitomyces sp. 'cryptogamus']|nr:hypothetical protein H2248_002851 [Termitomyces sp. 'cryptogamus']